MAAVSAVVGTKSTVANKSVADKLTVAAVVDEPVVEAGVDKSIMETIEIDESVMERIANETMMPTIVATPRPSRSRCNRDN